jgi:ABC-type nitrate/sulfonate/bicarbonate transport system permease component
MGVSFILVVAAEMIASPNGLGQLLFYSGQILRIDRVFAVLVVLAFLGWLMTKAQERLDARIAPWARIETRG